MRSLSTSFTLAAAMLGAALAACGETTPPATTPPSPTLSSAPTATPPTAMTTAAPTATSPTATTAAVPTATTAPPPAGDPNLLRPTTASQLTAELKDVGMDISKLPPMSKMSSGQKSKVMKIISKATGMACKDCHVDGNFKAETPNRTVARHMWDEYVVALKLSDGSPLFCDSCHHGHDDIIPRGPSHKDQVSAFMDANFVKKFSVRAGDDVQCTTCHTADYELKIFNKLWKAGKPERSADAGGPVGSPHAGL